MSTTQIAKPKTETYSAIEDDFDLANVVGVERDGQTMWALLNSLGATKQFVYGYTWQPTHESQITLEGVKAIRAGLKELLPLDHLTLISRIEADDQECQTNLANLAAGADPETRFFIYGNQYRVQELTEQGVRKLPSFYIYFTYTVDPATAEATDRIEALAAFGLKLWHRHFTARGEELEQQEKIELLNFAFDAWQERTQVLATKMRLAVEPMDREALWQYLWRAFNGKKRPYRPLPHWILLNAKGELKEEHYREQLNGHKGHPVGVQRGHEMHMTSLLIANEPKASEAGDCLYLPDRDLYVGIADFDEPPEGWDADPLGQRWLFDEVISSPKVVNAEIVTQFTWVNSENNLSSLQKFTKQQVSSGAHARDQNTRNVKSDLQATEAEEAQVSLIRGDTGIYVACVIIVYAKTESSLNATLRHIKNKFHAPAEVVRQRNYTWREWLQTLPLRSEALRFQPQDFRMRLRISDAVNFIQGVTTRSRSKRGVEFIAEHGGAPICVSLEDEMGSPRHGLIFGRSGSGKSCMSNGFLILSNARGMTTTIVDLPKGNGISTYSPIVKFLGGAEFNTGKNRNNLLEQLDLRHLPSEVKEERLQSFYKNTIKLVLSLILDTRRGGEPLPVDTIESLVTMAVTTFFNDPLIQRRGEAALDAGIGTAVWEDWPTLKDLLGFFNRSRLGLEDYGTEVDRAIDFCRLRLRYWLSSPVGQAISKPSSFDGRLSNLKLFSLRELSSDEEAAILGASAQAVALRSALSSPRSFYYIDEASIFLGFPELNKSAGFLYATARGGGTSMLMATQDPNILTKGPGSAQILQNTSYRITGKANRNAIPSFENIFLYPYHVIAPNTEDSFAPSRREVFSRWLVDDDGLLTACRHYPPYNSLAMTMNNPNEVAARDSFFERYADKYEAGGRFTEYVVECSLSGREI